MDIIQSETNRGKNSINFDDHTYRLSNVFKMETSRTDAPKKVVKPESQQMRTTKLLYNTMNTTILYSLRKQ